MLYILYPLYHGEYLQRASIPTGILWHYWYPSSFCIAYIQLASFLSDSEVFYNTYLAGGSLQIHIIFLSIAFTKVILTPL